MITDEDLDAWERPASFAAGQGLPWASMTVRLIAEIRRIRRLHPTPSARETARVLDEWEPDELERIEP